MSTAKFGPRRHIDVVVLDATNLLHRCHHAMAASQRRAPDGTPLWAVGGLLGYIARFLDHFQPHKIVVGFDGDGCPHRRSLAPDYKAGRSATDPELAVQLQSAPDIVAACGFAVGRDVDWEADDVCATVATKARGTVAIVTEDKDAHQLISPKNIVVKPGNGVFDDTRLYDKYQVTGSRWSEYAALVGEKSDNLPGVTGIGPKRAASLIAVFDDVVDAFTDLDRVAAVVGSAAAVAMTAGPDTYLRNRAVNTLRGDLTLGVTGALPDPATVRTAAGEFHLEREGQRIGNTLSRRI